MGGKSGITSVPKHASVWLLLAAQDRRGRDRSALVTDIDNTFFRRGDGAAMQAAERLAASAARAPYPIIAITGDNFSAAQVRIQNHELPPFDVLATSVGTEVWYLAGGKYVRDESYSRLLAAKGYDRPAVVKAAEVAILQLQKQGAAIQLQQKIEESYKVSLYFYAANEQTIQNTTNIFKNAFPNFSIIVCEEVNHNASLRPDEGNKKYCLDILAATKADAVDYLVEQFNLRRGVVAGDSGNDADMLLRAHEGFIAVAVGGHTPELRTALPAKSADKPIFIDTSSRRAAQSLLLFDSYLRGGDLFTW